MHEMLPHRSPSSFNTFHYTLLITFFSSNTSEHRSRLIATHAYIDRLAELRACSISAGFIASSTTLLSVLHIIGIYIMLACTDEFDGSSTVNMSGNITPASRLPACRLKMRRRIRKTHEADEMHVIAKSISSQSHILHGIEYHHGGHHS